MITRDEEILVIRRGPEVSYSGHLAPVSGRVEPGESEAETLVREAREEVGLEVRPIERVWDCPAEGGTYHLHWWLATYVSGDLVLDEYEVSEARWIAPEDFAELHPTFTDDRRFFAEVFPTLKAKRMEGR